MGEKLNYFIALEPEKNLFEKIVEGKEYIKSTFGNQTYLKDKPHLTLYVSCTSNKEKLKTLFNDYCEKHKIDLTSKSSGLKIVDWLEFPLDPITNGFSLALEFDKESIEKLKQIQMYIINEFNQLRNNSIPTRYKNKSLNKVLEENLIKYGYPFTGEIWLPHISFCSFEKSNYVTIFKEKYNLDYFKGNMNFGSICLYELNRDEVPMLISKITL